MARVQTPAAEAIYLAAATFVERALRRDDSLFGQGAEVWTSATLDDLHQCFVLARSVPNSTFEAQFEAQLAEATTQTAAQLAAEALFVHFLIAIDVGGKRKRELINMVLSWSERPIGMPADLDAVLDTGIVTAGPGYAIARSKQLSYLFEFVRHWKSVPRDERESALGDPWLFRDIATSVDCAGFPAQREALLHLIHPDAFEPILSPAHKAAVCASFADAPGQSSDVDRRLAEIRAALAPKYGEAFSFYQKDVAEQWRSSDRSGSDADNVGEQREVRVWWVNQGSTYDAERAGGYLWAPQKNKAGNMERHWTNMTSVQPGDVVVHYATPAIRALSVATAAAIEKDRPGELAEESWDKNGWLISVETTDLAEAVPLAELPEAARPAGQGPLTSTGTAKQGYLWDVPESMAAALRQFFGDQWPRGGAASNEVLVPINGGGKVTPQMARHPIYEHIVEKGFSFPDWMVTDYLLSLGTKPFVLLSGISGTGKTKMAQLVAEYLAPPIKVLEPEGEAPTADAGSFVHTVGTGTLDHGAISVPLRYSALFPELPSTGSVECRLEAPGFSSTARFYSEGSWTKGSNASIRMRREAQRWLGSVAKKGDYLLVTPENDGEFVVRLAVVPTQRREVPATSSRVAFISVRADWTDGRAMLGYYNPLTETYVATELLRLLLHAAAHPDEPHFVILDEMNLAKVEYYFSDFLSAMESDTEIVLHDAGEDVNAEVKGRELLIPERIRIPTNLLFTGTVNVDETTFMFSPKVLDRANVIQFHAVDLKGYGGNRSAQSSDTFALPAGVDLEQLLRVEPARRDDYLALDPASRSCLETANELLATHHLHFGYRVANEIARYLRLTREQLGAAAVPRALDLQIQQKILPKFVGNRAKLEQPLWELLTYLETGKVEARPLTAAALAEARGTGAMYPESVAALARMLETLRQVGFASFIE